MPYTPNSTWVDGSGGGTPISAARLNNLEDGVDLALDRELDYTQITAAVSITATTAATANTIVTASAITFDGTTTVWVNFGCPFMVRGTTYINVHLWDGSTDLGQIGYWAPSTGHAPAGMRRRITPSAASHTFSIRAFVDAGTGTIGADAGTGPTTPNPAFIEVVRA